MHFEALIACFGFGIEFALRKIKRRIFKAISLTALFRGMEMQDV